MSEDDYKIYKTEILMWTSADPLTRQSAGRMAEHKKRAATLLG